MLSLAQGRACELPAPAGQSPLSLPILAPLTSVPNSLHRASLEICSPTLNSGPTRSRPARVAWPHLATGMAGWTVGKPKPGLGSLAVPRQSPFLSRLRRWVGKPRVAAEAGA